MSHSFGPGDLEGHESAIQICILICMVLLEISERYYLVRISQNSIFYLAC